MMKRIFHILSFILLFSFGYSEGSRELMNNNCSNHGYLQIWDNADPLRAFATYNCPEHYRLYIRVSGGERIYMGFHVVTDVGGNPNTPANNVWMRLKDPDGNIVLGPVNLNQNMGSGWIDSCPQVMIGPGQLYTGGYNALVYNVPAGPGGNYYIEFAINNNPNTYQKRVFRWFDITVARFNGINWVEKKGRLWSRKWDFTTRSGTNQFVGTLYTYSNDSIVTSFDFNGMQPWGFEVSCNSFGATNVGTPQQRRRSNYRQAIIDSGGIPSAPEYPVFLNDPDIEFYPTGIVAGVDSFSIIPCTANSYCIYVSLTKPGSVSVVLNFPSPYTPRTFVQNLNAGPNCINWDGKDGSGNTIPDNTVVNAVLDFYTGLTHLPLVDVEEHVNGFKVILVRPTHRPNNTPLPQPKIYWNDSLLTDPWNSLDGVSNLTGCTPTPALGCHRWTNRGKNNANPEVINTWWFTNSEQHTFVLNIDSTKWKVFSDIITCTGPDGVVVKFKYHNDISFSSISWNITTNPPDLLGTASDTTFNYIDPEWTEVYLTFPVVNNGNAVIINFTLNAVSSQYPYCQSQDTLICAVLPVEFVNLYYRNGKLYWDVNEYHNVQRFVIEKSHNFYSFDSLDHVSGDQYRVRYEYNISKDTSSFYRIKSVSSTGNVIYSNVVEVIRNQDRITYEIKDNTLVIYSPVNTTINIFSTGGHLVYTGYIKTGYNEINLDNLSNGVYYILTDYDYRIIIINDTIIIGKQ